MVISFLFSFAFHFSSFLSDLSGLLRQPICLFALLFLRDCFDHYLLCNVMNLCLWFFSHSIRSNPLNLFVNSTVTNSWWLLYLLLWARILRRNGVGLIVNKRVRNAVFGCSLKNNRMILVSFFFSVYFQSKPFNITVIQVYAPTTNAEEAAVEWFYEDLQDLLEKWSLSVVSNFLGSHGLQPPRFLCPWDFPGKSTGGGCHFLLQGNLPDCRDWTWVSCIAGRRFTL